MNVRDDVVFKQPASVQERADVAQACVLGLRFEMPMVLDELSNAVDEAYSALPERLYVIDETGHIRWRSGPGPWGFDVDGWEREIRAIAGGE